jgi:hypothetical protein
MLKSIHEVLRHLILDAFCEPSWEDYPSGPLSLLRGYASGFERGKIFSWLDFLARFGPENSSFYYYDIPMGWIVSREYGRKLREGVEHLLGTVNVAETALCWALLSAGKQGERELIEVWRKNRQILKGVERDDPKLYAGFLDFLLRIGHPNAQLEYWELPSD